MEDYAYILLCSDGTYYCGWTNDPGKREKAHNSGRGSRYTRARRPVRMVYTEKCADRSSAMKREAQLKKLSHAEKQKLADAFRGEQDGIY
jgi:putative endonuclease